MDQIKEIYMTSFKSQQKPTNKQTDRQWATADQLMDCHSIRLQYRDLLLFTAQYSFEFLLIDNQFNI